MKIYKVRQKSNLFYFFNRFWITRKKSSNFNCVDFILFFFGFAYAQAHTTHHRFVGSLCNNLFNIVTDSGLESGMTFWWAYQKIRHSENLENFCELQWANKFSCYSESVFIFSTLNSYFKNKCGSELPFRHKKLNPFYY